MVKIPKIIHQIYFDLGHGKLKDTRYYKSHISFKKIKGFKYKLWNERECDNLVKNNFSKKIYNFYINLRFGIQKLELLRFCILYKYGGIYIDLDIYPLKNFNTLLNRNILFHNIIPVKSNYAYIENDLMGSIKHNPFWLELIDYSMKQYKIKSKIKIYDSWKGRFVNQTTGPKMISRFVKKYYPNIKPLSSIVYTKFNKDNKKKYYFEDFNFNDWTINEGKSTYNVL